MNSIWYYALIVLLVAVDGEVAILIAAGAASTGFLNPVAVFLAGALGNIVSDAAWYALGYYGRIDWFLSHFKWMRISPGKLASAKEMVDRDAVKLLTMAKLTNWMTIPVLIATGASRVAHRRWFPLVVASNFLISLILVLIGYYMASSFLQIKNGLQYAGVGFTLLFILFVLFSVRRYLNKKEVSAESETLQVTK